MIKKICNKQGCNTLVIYTNKYCEKHKDQAQADTYERNKHYDLHRRDKESTGFYSSKEWKELRELVKTKFNGLCSRCLDNKLFKAGMIADHKIPIKIDWSLRLIESNIDYLCLECHNTKTAEDKRKYNI